MKDIILELIDAAKHNPIGCVIILMIGGPSLAVIVGVICQTIIEVSK